MVSTAAFHARVRGSVPGLGGLKETKLFLPHPRVKVSIVGSLRDREVACSASDRQGSNFESCVWRTVSSQSSHHPQEVLLAQFSLYVHKGGLKPDSFHFLRRASLCRAAKFSKRGPTMSSAARENPVFEMLIMREGQFFTTRDSSGCRDWPCDYKHYSSSLFNPLTAKLFNLNFHSLKVVSR